MKNKHINKVLLIGKVAYISEIEKITAKRRCAHIRLSLVREDDNGREVAEDVLVQFYNRSASFMKYHLHLRVGDTVKIQGTLRTKRGFTNATASRVKLIKRG